MKCAIDSAKFLASGVGPTVFRERKSGRFWQCERKSARVGAKKTVKDDAREEIRICFRTEIPNREFCLPVFKNTKTFGYIIVFTGFFIRIIHTSTLVTLDTLKYFRVDFSENALANSIQHVLFKAEIIIYRGVRFST